MTLNFLKHRNLIRQLTWREVVGRYKGQSAGLFWSLLNPVLMLAVYTFVFSVVFQARWGTREQNKFEFALVLFIGMMIHGLLAEVLTRSSTVIASNSNFVKKVVFPLEILPMVLLGSACFHLLASLTVLLAGVALVHGAVPWTAVLFPVVLFPFLVLALGIGWIVATLGVYIKDTSQIATLLSTVMLFMAPVFYPIEALPKDFRAYLALNPLTFIIEQSRDVLLWGKLPDLQGLGLYLAIAVALLIVGYMFFERTKPGFADVI